MLKGLVTTVRRQQTKIMELQGNIQSLNQLCKIKTSREFQSYSAESIIPDFSPISDFEILRDLQGPQDHNISFG